MPDASIELIELRGFSRGHRVGCHGYIDTLRPAFLCGVLEKVTPHQLLWIHSS